MPTYTGTGNFSSGGAEKYRLDVSVTTTQVSGGTELAVSATATMFDSSNITPAFSSSGSRGYSVPGGRTFSTSGSFLTSGSATWSYDFGSNATQTVWGGFNRYVAYSYGSSTTVTITASGSGSTFLQDASVTVNVPLFSESYNYAINYFANGGSGTTSSTTTTSSSTSVNLTVANNGFSRSGYTFTGWNTSSGGGGTSYSPGQTATLTSSSPTLNLYAQWQQEPAPVWSNGVDNYSTVRVGQSFSDYLQASNTTSYSLVAAPSGLYVQDYGSYAYISGTVNATTSGTRTITVRATGPGGSTDDFDTFELRQALPSWTDDSLPNGKVGQSYSGSISASNTSYWSINESISGISATDTSGTTASLTGTPTSFGSYTVSATPYNSDNESGGTRNISVTIEDSDISWTDNTLSTTTVVEGQAYSDGVSATGSSSISYSVSSGSLPTGINLNTSTGAITGTPTSPGSYTFTIQANNGDSSDTITTSSLNITVEVAGGFMKVWNGSAWVEAPAKVWNGSAWVEGTVKVWNGSAWVDSFSS